MGAFAVSVPSLTSCLVFILPFTTFNFQLFEPCEEEEIKFITYIPYSKGQLKFELILGLQKTHITLFLDRSYFHFSRSFSIGAKL